MGGGELQLAISGSSVQDFILTGNPQITFYKMVYKKYSNFSMESITQDFNGGSIKQSQGTTLFCTLERSGDLVSEIYFCFELPEIYSGKYSEDNSEPYYNYEFQWIKNIGVNIIDSVNIKIGSQIIDEQFGEWMQIWNELNLNESEKKNYYEMIGNVPELYSPGNARGQNGLYPHITSGNTSTLQSNKYNDYFTKIITINDASENITFPSIKSRKIKVPLTFWFNKNKGLALPLISLQNAEVKIEIKLRPIEDLYTVIETKSSSSNFKKRVKTNRDTHNTIENFIIDSDFVNVSGTTRSLKTFDIKPFLEVNYVFLNNDERKKFALTEHKYLITQVSRLQIEGVSSDVTEDLEFNQSSKYLVWVGRRNDTLDRNDWNNYTNWLYEEVPPYSNEYSHLTGYGTNFVGSSLPFYNESDSNHKLYFKPSYLQKQILKTTEIQFNGNVRLREKDSLYYKTQIFNYFKTNNKNDGIHVYSFSINPKEFQPSGNCNFSKIDTLSFKFEINDIPLDSSNNLLYKYDFNIYSVNYNIFRVMNGVGGLQFAS